MKNVCYDKVEQKSSCGKTARSVIMGFILGLLGVLKPGPHGLQPLSRVVKPAVPKTGGVKFIVLNHTNNATAHCPIMLKIWHDRGLGPAGAIWVS